MELTDLGALTAPMTGRRSDSTPEYRGQLLVSLNQYGAAAACGTAGRDNTPVKLLASQFVDQSAHHNGPRSAHRVA